MNAKELRIAVRSALDSGMPPNQITDLVGIVLDGHCNPEPVADADRIYEVSNLPAGAITLGEAVRKYEVPRTNIQFWIRSGRIAVVGRFNGFGGPQKPLLANEAQVAACVDTWRRYRPRKKRKSKKM